MRVLWEGEGALAAARRQLVVTDPHRGLAPPQADPLACADALLVAVETYAAHGLVGDARAALDLAWPALHLAARGGSDPGHVAALSRALREADEALVEVIDVDNYAEVA